MSHYHCCGRLLALSAVAAFAASTVLTLPARATAADFPAPGVTLDPGPWAWDRLEAPGETTVVTDPRKYQLEFKGNGELRVRADCNPGTTVWKVDGGGLSVRSMRISKRQCASGSLGERFVRLVESAGMVRTVGSVLFLELPGGGVMKFLPAARLYVAPDAGFRMALPASWAPGNYGVREASGGDARREDPRALAVTTFECVHPGGEAAPKPLLRLILVSAGDEEAVATAAGTATRKVLESSGRVLLAVVPSANPYPEGDARTVFDRMAEGIPLSLETVSPSAPSRPLPRASSKTRTRSRGEDAP